MRPIRWILSSLTLVLVLCASVLAHAQVRVVATTPDLAAIAKAVGGSDVSVTSLAVSTQDPHYVDARPNLLVPLSRAQLLIVNGLELEVGWLPPLLSNARNRNIMPGASGHLDASSAITVLGTPTGPVDRSHGDVHVGGNPHFTFDPRRVKDVASAIRDRLIQIEPAKAAQWRANTTRFHQELDTVIADTARQFSSIPSAKRQIVTYHSSLPYLLNWLGLQEATTVEPLPGIDPTPRHTANVLQTMRTRGLRVILQEEFYPRSTSNTLANMTQGEVVVLPGGTRFERGESYIEHIREVTRLIHAAISR